MKLNKVTLLAASAAISAISAGAVQAQSAFPSATIVGAGATLVQNVTRQAGDCYGIKNDLGFGASGSTPQASVSLGDFNYAKGVTATIGNRFNCAGNTANTPLVSPNFADPRMVQPNITTRYLSTGSGQGVVSFLNNRVSSNFNFSAGFPAYVSADGHQYSFSETALSSGNITTYNTTLINPFGRYGATGDTAANLFGPPIQVPVVLTNVAVGYSPVYAKVRAGDGSITEYRFRIVSGARADNSGGLKLTRAQYCGIYNGVITNWNQLPTTVVNKDLADSAAFNVPIVLVGRSETSGTTSLFTRAIAAQCTGLSVANGVGGTGAPVAITNKFGNSENRLPYDGVTTVTGTAYVGAAGVISPTNSLSGAFFNKGTGVLTGTEVAGLFTVSNGNDGVALATAFHPDPSATPGDRTQNGRINYVSPEQTLPATIFNQANTLGLNTASLQVNGIGTTFSAPIAAQAIAAFGTVSPPQSKGAAGAYCNNATACPAAYGNRANPLDWVQSSDKSVANAAPTKGYPIIGTSNALLYTCYATPERRRAVAGFFAFQVGKSPKDHNNQTGPATVVSDTVEGIFAKNGLAPLPAAWRTAITETFLKRSAQLGTVGNPASSLGLLNLWIQDKIPTTPTGAGATTAGNVTICATKQGA
ncbi:substrate-binding domain-containing protein [Sandarakinorhabdus sp.]|uniref:substrate-binding domain-containing protein n=1 Tax=Sandarakinorhabdus sp. TaxID=1916663 RepID=UPI00286E1CCD|nr:substrate-binding domain-containing protein [Sandarakinorhabdus sp.]